MNELVLYVKYSPALKALKEECDNCQVYIAMLEAPLEDRRMWVMENLFTVDPLDQVEWSMEGAF